MARLVVRSEPEATRASASRERLCLDQALRTVRFGGEPSTCFLRGSALRVIAQAERHWAKQERSRRRKPAASFDFGREGSGRRSGAGEGGRAYLFLVSPRAKMLAT